MKKILCMILCAAFLFCCVSCQEQEEGAPDGMKKASADGAGFSVYVPAEWQVRTGEKSQMAEARVSDEDSSNITVMRYYNTEIEIDTTVENYAELAIRAYWDSYISSLEAVYLDSEGKTTLSVIDENGYKCVLGSGWEGCGVTAIEYDYTATLGGVDLYYAQVIAFYDNYFYIVTFTTRPDLFETHSADVANIIKYVKVK